MGAAGHREERSFQVITKSKGEASHARSEASMYSKNSSLEGTEVEDQNEREVILRSAYRWNQEENVKCPNDKDGLS